jgi:hypothetical protein
MVIGVSDVKDAGIESCGVSSESDRRVKMPMMKQRASKRQTMEKM